MKKYEELVTKMGLPNPNSMGVVKFLLPKEHENDVAISEGSVFPAYLEETLHAFRQDGFDIDIEGSHKLYKSGIIAADAKTIDTLRFYANRYPKWQEPILIYGERGSGKESMARFMHENGPRRGSQFIALNCAAFTETLLESELFGHIKGAFTGAIRNKTGKIELADKGILFLDEVSHLSLHAQELLLRVLQEKKFEKVGSDKSIDVDVQIYSATNRSYWELVVNNKMLPDFFDRIAGLNVNVPSLRERNEIDRAVIAIHYIFKEMKTLNIQELYLPKILIYLINNIPYSGNVREMIMICKSVVHDILAISEYTDISLEKAISKWKNDSTLCLLKQITDNRAFSDWLSIHPDIPMKEKGWELYHIYQVVDKLSPATKCRILRLSENEPLLHEKRLTPLLIGFLIPDYDKACRKLAECFKRQQIRTAEGAPISATNVNNFYSYEDLLGELNIKEARKKLIDRFDKEWIVRILDENEGVAGKVLAKKVGLDPSEFSRLRSKHIKK